MKPVKIVAAYKDKATESPEILYSGIDGDVARNKMESAMKGKDAPYYCGLWVLGLPLKRLFNAQPTKEELAAAKKRDEKEASIQKALKPKKEAKKRAKD